MVTITNFYEVERKDGTKFISIELTGSAELIQAQTSGKWYATVRRCRIPSTFDENTAMAMVGQRLEGEIVKVIVPAYEYTDKKTGEVMTLQHSYAYAPADSKELIGHTQVENVMSV
jgi:hypothetical protein